MRLTTITIFLAVLRNALLKHGDEKLAHAIQTLIARKDINGEDTYVLQTETSYPFFQEHIQKLGKPDLPGEPGQEEEALRLAFEYLTNNVEGIAKAIHDDPSIADDKKKEVMTQRLTRIRDTLLRLKVIFIELDDEDDAYLIFETLNTRGKDLEVADLVKNHILKHLPKKVKEVDPAREKWDKIRQSFDESAAEIDINSFILHYWLSKHDYVSEKQVFKEIKGKIDHKNAKEFVDELVEESRTYRVIHEPEFRKKWRADEFQLAESLRALNLFRVRQQMPMVMATMRQYQNGILKRKDAERLLRAIECFHFTFTAITSQRSSGGISFMYASAAQKLMGAADAPGRSAVIKEFIQKLRDRIPPYEEFSINFGQVFYSDVHTKQRNLARYILKEIDRSLRKGEAVDYTRMTVEHIAAQNPAGGQELAPEIVAKLGNLVLVPQDVNNKLANMDFPKKRAILKDNDVLVDEVIDKAMTWGAEEIEVRTRWLAQVAYEDVWAI